MSDHTSTTFPGSSNGARAFDDAHRPRGPYDRADSPEGVSDDLAALFLGVEDQAEQDTPATQVELKPASGAGKPALSLLVLGNLPVHAAGWASQYARDRHRDTGRPIGLLTLGDDAARLEVFGAASLRGESESDLERAVQQLARLDADLIVRLPEAEAGWIGGECDAASMTILAGADDPAIVRAYQSIKSISQDLPPDAAGPTMRFSVAGSPTAVAAEAAGKLAQAAERFLGLRIEAESPVLRIDAGDSTELYHGQSPAWADVPDLLGRALERHESAGVETRPGAGDQFERRRKPVPAGFDAEGGEIIHAKPTKKTVTDTVDQHPSDDMRSQTETKAHALTLPEGLETIEVSCPYAHEVKLAVDGAGVLHAVAWAADSERASAAVRDLVVASSWLRDHAELVAVVLGRRLSGLPSVRHLVMDDARGALGLAQGELRLHVQAPNAPVLIDLN